MAKYDKLIEEIRDRFKEAFDAVSIAYDEMIDDLNFLNGKQWPDDLQKEREADGRPCLTINKLPTFADQVAGDMRMNSPSLKIKPVDSRADPETAEVLTGLIRNIEVQSNAEAAYDTAAESAVQCGKGTFRIVTEYADDDVFEQDIRIKRVKNPFTVYWDPGANEWDKSDADWAFITERISRDEYERLYPKATFMDAEGGKDRDAQWGVDKTVRVAEYFKKVPENKTLMLLREPTTGQERVSTENSEGWEVINQRTVKTHKIVWCKTNGREILDGPNDWPGKLIPIIEVWGKELNIEGKSIYRGIVRFAKDSQRLYNYSRSHGAEVTSLAPKSPFLVTAKQIGNYQAKWDQAHKKNFPYLPYDIDQTAPPPVRQPPISANTGITQEILVSDQEMHDTTGLQLSNLGKKSNERSGKAIRARAREGDVANFAYYDNLARGLTYAGKVLLDLIPKIYDTARIVRILNDEGSDAFVPINQPLQRPDGRGQIFDLTVGKYDVVVTIGPSYSTQREEAADSMMTFLQAVPDAGPLIADLVAKNMDWPGASEFEKRLKALLPPGIAAGDGGQPPPPPQPPPPDPLDVAKHQKTMAEIERILIDNKHTQLLMEKTEAEIDKINQEVAAGPNRSQD